MRTWYNITSGDKKSVVCIYDAIGEFGVSAKSFLNDFRAVKAQEVDVEINSPGGDVFAGIAIFNGMRQSGKKINVKVMGVAASAASLIAMAGDTIEMPENTFMMIHNPWTFAMGSADDMRETADMLDKIGSSLVSTYASRTGKDAEEIKTLLDAETWMTAQEAVDAGFATKVTKAVAAKAEFDADRVPEHVKAVLATLPDAAPAPEPTPEPEPENAADSSVENQAPEAPEPETKTVAEQVAALADAAGMSAFTTHLVLSCADVVTAQARVSEIKDIKTLCKLVKQDAKADPLITAGKTLAQVREELQNHMAGDDAEVDTSIPTGKQADQAQPTASLFKHAWAQRV